MTRVLRRSLLQRILGRPATRPPADPGCVVVTDFEVVIDLNRAPELDHPGGAIRLEGGAMPERILVYRADDGRLRAVRNRCTHGGRRLDPVPGERCVQCCSLGHSTFDGSGRVVGGPAKAPLDVYWTRVEDGKLRVLIRAPGDLAEAASG